MSTLVPAAANLLRLAIIHAHEPVGRVFRGARWWLLACAAIVLFCQTPMFLVGAEMPRGGGMIARPIYGPGFALFAAYLMLALSLLVYRSIRDARVLTTIQRTELQFVWLGCSVGIFTALLVILIPMLGGTFEILASLPLAVVLFDSIIAYGIATRRIMDMPHFLSRSVAYMLLSVYLILLYFVVWGAASFGLKIFGPTRLPVPHLLAALAVAFALAPAHGFMQRFANRLFVNIGALDAGLAIQKASQVLASITTLDDLLKGFRDVVAQSVGTDRVRILLAADGGYRQRYPAPAENHSAQLADADAVVETLRRDRQPLVLDMLERFAPTPVLTAAGRRMTELQTAIAIGIFSKTGMEGIMLLGQRLNGRIYGVMEQRVLQMLCNQLEIALENARLYTQVQNGKIYNDILLDHLMSGVVAADTGRLITMFNREAQRLLNLTPEEVLGRSIESLPPPLAQALETALTTDAEQRNREEDLRLPGGDVRVRLDATLFHGHAGQALGALAVFHDLTALRELERQLRRADRLAALGTISAGMAHEIKNPLVTIKTFTQLLPERYEDRDFRDTFLPLVGQEVKRIDTLVTQLLNFARPAKPNLAPLHLHEVVANSLKLVQQRLDHGAVKVINDCAAVRDLIRGDASLLSQAFVNFFLNALDAMQQGGELRVTTAELPAREWVANINAVDEGPVAYVRIVIRDTGEGIKPGDIPRIFDPFFTTKSYGTGLGLSVAHGILQEHGGIIDVVSEVGKGTAIVIDFPQFSGKAQT
jgi:PAS domain S-box-containing protein